MTFLPFLHTLMLASSHFVQMCEKKKGGKGELWISTISYDPPKIWMRGITFHSSYKNCTHHVSEVWQELLDGLRNEAHPVAVLTLILQVFAWVASVTVFVVIVLFEREKRGQVLKNLKSSYLEKGYLQAWGNIHIFS